jgi:hypothetical protein
VQNEKHSLDTDRDGYDTDLTSGLIAILRAIAKPQMPRAAPMAANKGKICSTYT